jgi:hypothetical protein
VVFATSFYRTDDAFSMSRYFRTSDFIWPIKKIAHNVPDYWRCFGRTDKQTVGLQPCQNVVEVLRGNGA